VREAKALGVGVLYALWGARPGENSKNQPEWFLRWGRRWVPRAGLIVLVPVIHVLSINLMPRAFYEEREQFYSYANVKEILSACRERAYTDELGWPDDLQTLVVEDYVEEYVLQNPRWPKRTVGYIYLTPIEPEGDLSTRHIVVMYEAYDKWPKLGVCVGFADGHVQVVRDEAKFRTLLGEAGHLSHPQED